MALVLVEFEVSHRRLQEPEARARLLGQEGVMNPTLILNPTSGFLEALSLNPEALRELELSSCRHVLPPFSDRSESDALYSSFCIL